MYAYTREDLMTKSEQIDKIIENLPSRGVSGTLLGTGVGTDEPVELPVYLSKPKNKKYSERWAIMFLTDDTDEDYEETGVSIFEQATEGKLTATDYRVRDYVFCRLGIGNYVHINQSEAARKLRIAQPNISTSIKKLITLGIILEGPKAGKFRTYQVNPAVVYAGGIGNGVKAKNDIVRQRKNGATVYKFPDLSK